MLLGSAYFAFRLPKVQTVVTQWVVKQLSHTFKTKISVGGVNISLLKSIVLENVLIEDQQQDTLLYVDKVNLKIDSLRLFKKRVHFGQISFIESEDKYFKE